MAAQRCLASLWLHPPFTHEFVVVTRQSPNPNSTDTKILPAAKGPQSLWASEKPRWMLPVFWLYSYSDYAIALLLLSALAISTFAIRKGPIVLRPFNFIDTSWALQLAFNSHNGVWLDRDVWLTYGPLFQWLSGSFTWLHGWSLGAFFKYGDWAPASLIVAATWLVSVLLLRGQPPWKRVFYVFAVVVFWMYWDIRPVIDVLLFAISAHECERLCNAKTSLLRGLCLGLLISAASLISADTGAYSLAAFLLVSFSWLYWRHSEAGYASRVLRLMVAVSAAVVLWTFLIGAVLTRSVSMKFWLTTSAILQGYRWAMFIPMDRDLSLRFSIVLGTTLVVFVLGWSWRDVNSRTLARHPAYLVSAALFSVLMLESSFVRADRWHIFFGLFPGIMLSGAVLMGADTDSRGRTWQYVPVLAALALTSLFSSAPNPRFIPSMLAQHLSAYRLPPLQTCPSGSSYLNDACFLDPDYELIHGVAQYLETHSTRSDWVAVFPYQNIFGIAANRRVAGGIVQNYAAIGEYLTARQIVGLEAEKPSLAVYSADGKTSFRIDSVPNLTRNPDVWLYLQSRYKTLAEPQPGVVVLRRDAARLQRWRMQATDLSIRRETQSAPLGRNTTLDVTQGLSWPADADFLKLTVQVHYPFWWHLLKPTQLLVRLGFSDGTEKSVVAFAAPNRKFDIWVYPWRDSDLQEYFSADESLWRATGSRTPVQSVSVMTTGADAFSVEPTSIRVTALQVVSLSLRAVSR